MATLTPDGKQIELAYRFSAHFEDGTCVEQNEDDVSEIDPSRSSFFDVLHHIEQGKRLKHFHLYGVKDCADLITVDLTDGSFCINHTPFKAHEEDLENFRVIYFRVRDNHFNMGGDFISHDIAYRIGWQANEKKTGKNVQRWIEIK